MNEEIKRQAIAAEEKARRLVKAHVFGDGASTPSGASKALPEETVFDSVYDQTVEPPYDMMTLARLVEQSSELGQVVEAMETNIEGLGHRLLPRVTKPETEEGKRLFEAERIFLTNFFDTVSLGGSFTTLRRRMRRDLEITGNAYIEVMRNARGAIVGLQTIPSYQVRLSLEDSFFTMAEVPQVVRTLEGGIELDSRIVYKRFRRFVQGQMMAIGAGAKQATRLRWFKAFGDPSVIHAETGQYIEPEDVEDWKGTGEPIPEGLRANEVIHVKLYSARTPYGVPRWIGNLLAVLGARSAEEVNYTTLKNNNIPSMVVSVSNGRLTEGTIDRIEHFVETQIRGSSNYSRFLLLEGEGAFEGEDSGHVKIDIQPLSQQQHTDALFSQYITKNVESIRRAFRLPPIFVGATDDYNKSTAEASRRLADEQVFAPERDEVDWMINNLILADLGVLYHRFQSRTPNVTDNFELIQMLANAERTGGITPRISRSIVEDVFAGAVDSPDLDPVKFDPDVPFSLTMAERMKKVVDPTEVNQNIGPVMPGISKSSSYDGDTIAELLEIGDRATSRLKREAGRG